MCLALLRVNDRFPLSVLPLPFTTGEGSELETQQVQETSGEPDSPKKEISKSPESRRASRVGPGQGTLHWKVKPLFNVIQAILFSLIIQYSKKCHL